MPGSSSDNLLSCIRSISFNTSSIFFLYFLYLLASSGDLLSNKDNLVFSQTSEISSFSITSDISFLNFAIYLFRTNSLKLLNMILFLYSSMLPNSFLISS